LCSSTRHIRGRSTFWSLRGSMIVDVDDECSATSY